jgi:hypothetical protein
MLWKTCGVEAVPRLLGHAICVSGHRLDATIRAKAVLRRSRYMIPWDKSRYEARFVTDFRQRGPYLFRLRG